MRLLDLAGKRGLVVRIANANNLRVAVSPPGAGQTYKVDDLPVKRTAVGRACALDCVIRFPSGPRARMFSMPAITGPLRPPRRL